MKSSFTGNKVESILKVANGKTSADNSVDATTGKVLTKTDDGVEWSDPINEAADVAVGGLTVMGLIKPSVWKSSVNNTIGVFGGPYGDLENIGGPQNTLIFVSSLKEFKKSQIIEIDINASYNKEYDDDDNNVTIILDEKVCDADIPIYIIINNTLDYEINYRILRTNNSDLYTTWSGVNKGYNPETHETITDTYPGILYWNESDFKTKSEEIDSHILSDWGTIKTKCAAHKIIFRSSSSSDYINLID